MRGRTVTWRGRKSIWNASSLPNAGALKWNKWETRHFWPKVRKLVLLSKLFEREKYLPFGEAHIHRLRETDRSSFTVMQLPFSRRWQTFTNFLWICKSYVSNASHNIRIHPHKLAQTHTQIKLLSKTFES